MIQLDSSRCPVTVRIPGGPSFVHGRPTAFSHPRTSLYLPSVLFLPPNPPQSSPLCLSITLEKMGLTARFLRILALSAVFLRAADSLCAPRPATNPIYPFLGDPSPAKEERKAEPAPPSPHSTSPVTPLPSILPPISGVFERFVKEVCNRTDNPDLCFSSVHPYIFPVQGKPANAAAVLDMEIKACSAKTQEARNVAAKIASDPATGKMMASILQTCTDSYDDAIDNLESAAKALAARDLATLNSMLSAAMTDYSTCEEGFQETPGINSPMADYDDLLTKLSSNCLAIAELVK